MNWQPTYHLSFPDMEVCEPDEHSHLEVYRLSIMGMGGNREVSRYE